MMTLLRLLRNQGDPLAVSIAGIKMGNRLLVAGCADPHLVARLAVKTGLTGRALAVDARPPLVERVAALAPKEGALVETAVAPWQALPAADGSFDVAVVHDVFAALAAPERAACAAELHRILRPGGRCLVIDRTRASGLAGILPRGGAAPGYRAAGGARGVLAAAPFRAVRILAERDGLEFTEAARENR